MPATPAQSTVEVTGERADEVIVEQDGRTISVIGPRQRSGFRREPALNVTATVPDPQPTRRTHRKRRHRRLRHLRPDRTQERFRGRRGGGGRGLGGDRGGFRRHHRGPGRGETLDQERIRRHPGHGNGGRRHLRVGSGDVEIDHTSGSASLKSGSGDLRVSQADGDLSVATGSGDIVVHRLNRGKFSVKSGSGNVAVGIPSGVPVWTDISTSSGTLQSDLASTGAPEEGQDYVELRLKSASGDITLKQL